MIGGPFGWTKDTPRERVYARCTECGVRDWHERYVEFGYTGLGIMLAVDGAVPRVPEEPTRLCDGCVPLWRVRAVLRMNERFWPEWERLGFPNKADVDAIAAKVQTTCECTNCGSSHDDEDAIHKQDSLRALSAWLYRREREDKLTVVPA